MMATPGHKLRAGGHSSIASINPKIQAYYIKKLEILVSVATVASFFFRG